MSLANHVRIYSLIYVLPVLLAVATLWIVYDQLFDIQGLSPSFIRQTSQASTIPIGFLPGIAGFWYWRLDNDVSSGVYVSYPSLAYLPLTLLGKLTSNIRSSFAILSFFSLSLLSLSAFVIGRKYVSQRRHFNGLTSVVAGLSLSFLIIAHPSLLNFLIDPNWEESFVFMSLAGFALSFVAPLMAAIAFFIAALSCPSAGIAACLFSILLIYPALEKFKRTGFVGASILSKVFAFLEFLSPLSRSLMGSMLGVFLYVVMRILFSVYGDIYPDTSGSSLLFRMGLDLPSTDYHGGILSVFRTFLPVSGIPKGISSLGWDSIVSILLLVEFLVLSLISILWVYRIACAYINGKDRSAVAVACLYFFFVGAFMIVVFPNWSSVHFRLLARLIAPGMSIAIWLWLDRYCSRICALFKTPWKSSLYVLSVTLMSWVVATDFIRFFYVWNLPFLAKT